MHNTTDVDPEENTKTPLQLSKMLEDQKKAFLEQGPPNLSERLSQLKTLATAIKQYQTKFCQAEAKDFGKKCEHEITLTEIVPLLEHIRYVCAKLRSWMKPDKRSAPLHFKPCKVFVQYEPLGCVGIVSPWNYPIALALSPLVDALAAGNTVLLKLSEFTEHTSAVIQELLSELFPSNQVAAICADATVAKAFVELPFDHLIYTGSTSIGQSVMKAAAKHITPVTLELGGKSPCVLGATKHFSRSVNKIAFGKCINSGQTCIAPDVLFCPKEKLDQFVECYFKAIANLYPDPLEKSNLSAIISDKHYHRLCELVEDAKPLSAKILISHEKNQTMSELRLFPPTLVLDPSPQAKVWQEEIFGPILVIKTYEALSDILPELRQWPSALTLYIFSDDKEEIQLLTQNSRTGSVCTNDTLMPYAIDDAPFGGVGPSGFGRYHAFEGFKTFSNPRTIVHQPNLAVRQLLHPPFGKKIQRLMFKFFLR